MSCSRRQAVLTHRERLKKVLPNEKHLVAYSLITGLYSL